MFALQHWSFPCGCFATQTFSSNDSCVILQLPCNISTVIACYFFVCNLVQHHLLHFAIYRSLLACHVFLLYLTSKPLVSRICISFFDITLVYPSSHFHLLSSYDKALFSLTLFMFTPFLSSLSIFLSNSPVVLLPWSLLPFMLQREICCFLYISVITTVQLPLVHPWFQCRLRLLKACQQNSTARFVDDSLNKR